MENFKESICESLREEYCEHLLKELSDRKDIKLTAYIFDVYGFNQKRKLDLMQDADLLKFVDSKSAGQALNYTELNEGFSVEICLNCSLGEINPSYFEGLNDDWFEFAMAFLQRKENKQLADRLLEEDDDFMDALSDFMCDYELSSIGDAMDLVTNEIEWLWDSQYRRRAKQLIAKRTKVYEDNFAQQVAYLPVVRKEIEQRLENAGALDRAVFNATVLSRLAYFLKEKDGSKDILTQKLDEKYNRYGIYDLKTDFLKYLRKRYPDRVDIKAMIPEQPHRYHVHLCTEHNTERHFPFCQTPIEYYLYHQDEVNRCINCGVSRDVHYYSLYHFEVKTEKKEYIFNVPFKIGKSWLPALRKLPQEEQNYWKKIDEEEMLWAYDRNLMVEVGEFMDRNS